MKRQAIAVASSCLQAGMHRVNPEILQPAKQRLPTFKNPLSGLGTLLAGGADCHLVPVPAQAGLDRNRRRLRAIAGPK
jgi:hypothetical protein